MKRYIMTGLMAALLCGAQPLNAQDSRERDSYGEANYMYVPSNTLLIDSEGKGELEIWLDNETEDFNTYIFDLYLPEGFVVEKNARLGYANSVVPNNGTTDDAKTVNHGITVGEHEGFYRVLGTSIGGIPILSNNDKLLTITVVAPEDFVPTRAGAAGSVKNIEIAAGVTGATPHYFPDINFTVDRDFSTGVEGVEVDGFNGYPEGIFDIQGRPIKADGELAPGIYIINGKKVIVK